MASHVFIMVNKSCRIFCCFVLMFVELFLMQSSSYSQEINDPLEAFDRKEYNGFINNIETVFPQDKQVLKNSFSRIVAAAIAVDKSDGWNGESEAKIKNLLILSSDAMQYLDALHKLLRGDINACTYIFDGQLPDTLQWSKAATMLVDHGYARQGHCFNILLLTGAISRSPRIDPGVLQQINDGLVKWKDQSTEDRHTIANLMYLRLHNNPLQEKTVASVALEIYLKLLINSKGSVTDDKLELYKIAKIFGERYHIISYDTADQLFQLGKESEAVVLVKSIAFENTSDYQEQIKAARYLLLHNKYQEMVAIYKNALITVHEPYVRCVRLEYYSDIVWLNSININVNGMPLLSTLEKSGDPLSQADVFFVEKEIEKSIKLYCSVFDNRKLPIEIRLDAWAGLLVTDPNDALHRRNTLLDDLAKNHGPERECYALWLGNECWKYCDWLLPDRSGRTIRPWQQSIVSLPKDTEWRATMLSIFERINTIEPLTCYKPTTKYSRDSLRIPYALLFVINGKSENAISILRNKVEWYEPVDKPFFSIAIELGNNIVGSVKFTSPLDGEFNQSAVTLLQRMMRSNSDYTSTAQYSELLLKELLNYSLTQQTNNLSNSTEYAIVLNYLLIALDAIANNQEKYGGFNPVEETAKVNSQLIEFLNSTNVARNAEIIITKGILPTLMVCNNHKVVDIVQNMLLETLAQYNDVVKDHVLVFRQVENIVITLKTRKDYPMNAFINKLVEKYPLQYP